MAAGQAAQVVPALQQLLAERPQTHGARALLIEVLLADGKLDEARSLLAEVTEDIEELRPLQARFALLDKPEVTACDQTLAQLAEQAAKADADPQSLYLYGLRAAAAGQFREGLEALLRLLAEHRSYQDGIAKEALLSVFACLPKGDALASEFRRRMFNYLH